MNTKHLLLLAVTFIFGSAQIQAQARADGASLAPGLEAPIKKLFADKEAQARALAATEGQTQAPEIWEFFTAGKRGDWAKVSSLYRTLRRGAYQYEGTRKDPRLETMVWQTVNEAFGVYEDCVGGEEEYVRLFAQEILDSMPRGSIYFGGTDPGRWLVTAFCKSHAQADPCFVLTQNALADGLYLKYLRTMYGDRIRMPTDADSKKAFDDYVADAEERYNDGKLKPGENFTMNAGKPQVSGQVAVMAINGLLVRTIFNANPTKEFFIEESFPLDWMYPHLSPHGLIMKIEREPQKELAPAIVKEDHDYWTRLAEQTVGPWLKPETPMETVCSFAKTVFFDKELGKFKGDAKFVGNASTCKTYSKLRSSIAGVYAWRATNSASAEVKKQMAKEADYAFRQAFVMCPYSPEVVFRFANLALGEGRTKEALLMAQTAEQIDPRNRSFGDLIGQLEDMLAEEKEKKKPTKN